MAQYHVLSIWWPEGWEPHGPGDVPNCAWHTELDPLEPLPLARPMGREEALATARALNRQVIDTLTDRWYIVAALDDEPLERTTAKTGSGMTVEETYRLHIVRPSRDFDWGNCSACPARELERATADCQDEPCVLKVTRSME